MRGFSKNILKIALFLTIMVVITAHADVKLRIYLQDGSLQAGNLVSETTDAFVILTKEGRVEVPKTKIMFVNGKTLKQWQERPDKLFSTEIMPNELPNPAYVHDKAPVPDMAAPPLPKIQPVADIKSVSPPAKTSAPVPPNQNNQSSSDAITASPAVSPSSEPKEERARMLNQEKTASAPRQSSEKKPSKPAETASMPADKAAALEEKKIEASTPPVVEKSEKTEIVSSELKSVQNPRKLRRRVKKSKEQPGVSIASKPVPVEKKVEASVPRNAPEPPSAPRSAGFNRAEMSSYHFDRAQEFLKEGWKGRAIQELHMAILLDRQKDKPVFELARLYMNEGEFEKAEKYFSSPLLRKNDEAKTLVEQIHQTEKNSQRAQWILFGSTGAVIFMTLPLVAYVRRFEKKRAKARRVITAENAEELVELTASKKKEPVSVDEILSESLLARQKPAEEAPNWMEQTHPRIDVSAVAEIQKPAEPEKAPEIAAVTPPPAPKPVAPMVPPTLKQPEPVSMPPVPPAEPVKPAVPIATPPDPIPMPIVSPIVPSRPEPVLEPVALTPPSSPVLLPSVEDVLAVGRQVDEALQRGNALAIDGDLDKARREYRTALALNPARVDAYIGLGYLCFLQGQWDLALEHYVKALQIDSNSAEAHYGIGRVLLETDRVEEAVPRFQTVLALDPTFDDARESLTALGKPV